METLKKIFPLSFRWMDTVANLVIGIVVYLVVGVLAGALIALATVLVGWLPVLGGLVGWALGVVGSLVGVYCFAGLVIHVLAYFKIIKD